MRYEIKNKQDNKVEVKDTVTEATYQGAVVNGYARSKNRLDMNIIQKALDERKQKGNETK